jgi:large subunit ribosomal protein L10
LPDLPERVGGQVAKASSGPFRAPAATATWRRGIRLAADWRQAVERAEKRELVETLNAAFTNTGVIVVAHYQGLTVADMQALRARMRDAGGKVKVAKNRLAKLALQGTDAEHIVDLFKGPTVIAYSADPVAAAKVAVDFSKVNDKLVILGGAMGTTNLNADGVKALASLPSLDELRAKLLGMLNTPATRIAQVVNAPASQLARVFAAYAKKDEAA